MITVKTSTAIMFGQQTGTDEEKHEHALILEYGRKNLREQISDHGCGRKSKQIFHAHTGELLYHCDL